jgi:hypothetical protein
MSGPVCSPPFVTCNHLLADSMPVSTFHLKTNNDARKSGLSALPFPLFLMCPPYATRVTARGKGTNHPPSVKASLVQERPLAPKGALGSGKRDVWML